MPNKTIYVSDDDLALFERAQQLSGANLSSAIVRALRRYIEVEEASQRGLEEITVIVNGAGAHRRKRFLGQLLIHWLQRSANGNGTDVINIYRTAGKRYAVHTRTLEDWPIEGGDPGIYGDPKNWGVGNGIIQRIMSWGYDWEALKESGNYSLQVYETLEDLKAHVSKDLYAAVKQAMDGPEVEELDI